MGALDGLRFRVAGDGVACQYAGWLLAGMGADVEVLTASDLTRSSALHAWLTAGASVRERRPDERLDDGADGLDALLVDAGERLDPALAGELDAISGRQPALAVAAVSPFGLSGPLAHRRATAYEVQAMCGIAHHTGAPSGPPMPVGGHVLEMATGANAALAALLGVRRTRRSGYGGVADVSMLETGAGLQASRFYTYAYTGLVLKRTDTVNSNLHGFLRCKDGYLSLTPHYTPWEYFTGLLGLTDEAFGDEVLALPPVLRYGHPKTIAEASRALLTKTRWEWVREAQTWRVPCVPIQAASDLLDDAQFEHQAYFAPFDFAGRTIKAPSRAIAGEIWGKSDGPRAGRAPAAHRANDEGPALEGLHVLEFGIGWSAPMSSVIFAQHGATVVRVESPTRMDTSRGLPLMDLEVRQPWYEYTYNYHPVNAGKMHFGCNLAGPHGAEVQRQLLEWADVVFTNYSPRALINLGLDGESIAKVNPACTTVNSTSFGFDGPYRDFVAYGTGMEGMTGVTLATGGGGIPYRSTMLHPDITSAMHNSLAAVASLLQRDRTGEGTFVDLRQYECGALAVAEQLLEEQLPAELRRAPRELRAVLPAAGDDRWLALTVRSAAEWEALLAALGAERVPTWDEALAEPAAARERLGVLTSSLERDEAAARLERAGSAAAPVLYPDEVLLLPHLHERGYFTPATTATFGTRLGIGYWSQLRGQRPAPLAGVRTFGADNRRVLTEILGFSSAEADAIEADGTVGTAALNAAESAIASEPIERMLATGHIHRRDADHAERLGLR